MKKGFEERDGNAVINKAMIGQLKNGMGKETRTLKGTCYGKGRVQLEGRRGKKVVRERSGRQSRVYEKEGFSVLSSASTEYTRKLKEEEKVQNNVEDEGINKMEMRL